MVRPARDSVQLNVGQLFKVQPYEHQRMALNFIRKRLYYALLMEQGTGKTAVLLNDGARRWGAGELDGTLVLAPNGVHANWTLREIPTHMPDWVQLTSAAWYASPNRSETSALDELFSAHAGRSLRILTMNWEALITKDGWEMALRFARSCGRLFLVGDESQRIKNPKAKRTKAVLRLVPYSSVRAISSGTAVVQSPWDAFSQFGMLHPSILQTESYVAFKAEFAELLPPGHGLLRHIVERTGGRYMPQIVARNEDGTPKWRNLDKLERLIAPHSYRVLKKDCLDLPEKIYTQRYFRMTSKQRKMYDLLRDEFRLKLENGQIAPVERIASITKMSQVVSGYFIVPGTDIVQRIMQAEDNPKLLMLMDEIEDRMEAGDQVIIWARFHAEIKDIMTMLKKMEVEAVEYHGEVPARQRQIAIDSFQGGLTGCAAARVFVGQQAAGGTGITLTAASSVIYYSNTWSLEDRLQSEDRAHRIGQRRQVTYLDLLAQDSIDDRVVKALRSKTDLAKTVLGDTRRALELLQ